MRSKELFFIAPRIDNTHDFFLARCSNKLYVIDPLKADTPEEITPESDKYSNPGKVTALSACEQSYAVGLQDGRVQVRILIHYMYGNPCTYIYSKCA